MRIFAYLWEGVKIAFDALRIYKMRSTLTTLGIVIGVMTVITIVALVQGLNAAFANQISSIGTDTLYVSKFPWMMNQRQWFEFRNRPNVTVDNADAIKEQASLVKAVAPTIWTRRNVKYKNNSSENILICGTTEDIVETSSLFPEKGRFLSTTDVTHRRAVTVLGWEVANNLFPDEDPVGKRINVAGKKFRVIGVVEKKGSIFGESQDANIYIPIGVFQATYGARFRSVQVEVKAISPDKIEDAEIQIEGIMRRERGLKIDEENNFAINKQSMLMETYKQLTTTLWAVAIGVGAISLLVGGIGIMNILLVSVTERTREIGVRKALGAKKADILWQFLIESMMICALGVIIGTGLAIGIAKLIAATTPVPAAITVWVAFLGVGFTATIGIFFGIYPASKAAKLSPIESLRYE